MGPIPTLLTKMQQGLTDARTGGGASPLELRLPAEAVSVPRARRALVDFAEQHGADSEAVAIAVSEAVGNALVHGYRDGTSGHVTVRGEIDGKHLLVTVIDEGVGMSPNPADPGLGLGLPLIGRVADSVEIERPRRGTRLLIRFPLAR
jgi:anti-sigma regulatory factor (Ser/Thr protein kinase)